MTQTDLRWVKVSPGHEIFEGQRYAIKPANSSVEWIEYTGEHETFFVNGSDGLGREFFVDSTWQPPLELPGPDPEWGILVRKTSKAKVVVEAYHLEDDHYVRWTDLDGTACNWAIAGIGKWIPLTNEQIKEIRR